MLKRVLVTGILAFILSTGCSSSSTIVILTDYGWNDPYAATMQGVILSINPDARLLTITHAAPNYNVREASYLLAAAAKEYPGKTVFLAVVDPGVGGKRRAIILETLDGKYFVGPDNGLFTDVVRSFGLKRAVEINNVLWFRSAAVSSTFHGRDIFAPAAAHLSAGNDMQEAGPVVEQLVTFERTPAEYSLHTGAKGEIIHADHYGNLISNIPATDLTKSGWQKGMMLEVKSGKQSISAKYVENYAAVPPGDFLLLINSQGLLELARNMASARDSLNVAAGDLITVHSFKPAEPEFTSPPVASKPLTESIIGSKK